MSWHSKNNNNFPGDRILSVNGETIQGRTYASVVQMIQNCADQLTLVVVPKEDDVIQQVWLIMHEIRS